MIALLTNDDVANRSLIEFLNNLVPEPELTISTPYLIYQMNWLTNDKLQFIGHTGEAGDSQYVWNRQTRHIERVGEPVVQTELYKNAMFTGRFYTMGRVGQSYIAPDEQKFIGFFDRFRLEVETVETDLSVIEERITPGFDVYFLTTGEKRHVDIDGHYIADIAWSPSSQQIIVIPYYRGDGTAPHYYRYGLVSDNSDKLPFPIYSTPTGVHSPVWSPDENWLALRTEEGSGIYQLDTSFWYQLSDEMTSGALKWSPVMDYNESTCSTG
jgi:hypothetical protein